MRGRRQEILALAAALSLHAGLLVFLKAALGEASARLPAAPARHSADEWEVELAAEPEGDVGRSPLVENAGPVGGSKIRSVAPAPARRAELASAGVPVSEPVPSAPEADHEPEPRTPSGKSIDLGLGNDGWQRWVTMPTEGEPPPPASTSPRKGAFQVFRAPPVSTTGGLQEGLEEHDRALGLGPEGRVLSALHHAAHAGVAPEVGVARFEVTVHRSGTVEVALGAFSRDAEQWKKVAANLVSDLRAAPPRIPPPREGLKLVVELAAEWTLPNGTKARELERPHLHAPPLKFRRTADAVEQTKRENPTTENPDADSIAIKLDSPGVYVAGQNRVCSYSAGIGSIAAGYRLGAAAGPVVQGACDPSNVGAKPQRVVRARVIEQSLF